MKKFYFLLLSFLALSLCANAETLSIDFESASTAYTDWTFTNMTSQQTGSITAHGGTNYGTTGGKTTASITTKSAIAAPQSITFYVSKQSTNKTSSSWKLQVSTDNSTWTDVKTQSATSMDKGNWVEVTQDLSSYSDVYVRIYYTGSTAVRNIDDVTLTYTVVVVAVAKPVITETSKADYGTAYLTTSTAKATIACATKDAKIRYAITDGAEPTTWSDYSAEVSINSEAAGTKTLWAKAVKDADESAVVKQEFSFVESIANTKETAYTTEQAIALIKATSAEQLNDEKVYVKGVISSVTSLNSDNSITYLLDDDSFTVYKGKNIDNKAFNAKEDLEIGAKVIAYGNITKYNSTYELNSGNVLVEYTPVTVQSIAINGEATKTEYEAGETFSTAGLEVIATMSDGSTADVTSSAAWTFEPETLALGTTIVKVTATYKEFSASKDVNVTVVAATPSVTLDLTTTDQIKGEPTTELLEYDATVLTVSSVRESTSNTAVNNYYPGTEGKTYTSTRFYAGNSLTFTPAANYEIVSITYNATSEGYANALATSTWENATATADYKTVTIVPTDGTQPLVATISGTTGATSMVIKYKETPIATEEGLDAVLLGEVGKKYQINTTLRVNYKDANYVYASTKDNNGCSKNTHNSDKKEEWWSDKEADFAQNDWVAIQNSGLEVGAEIATGSVATLVSNSEFPVIEFVSMSKTNAAAIEANTFRVANFNISNSSPLVNNIWLVAPQPAEHCFVKGYVDVTFVEADGLFAQTGSEATVIEGTSYEPLDMVVNLADASTKITTSGWYVFEGVVVNGSTGLQLNAISAKEGSIETGVEGVEASSVKVYGAEGVINVVSEEVAPIAVYSANGAIVSSVEASSASIAVAPGFYIVKAGNSVSKVTVK